MGSRETDTKEIVTSYVLKPLTNLFSSVDATVKKEKNGTNIYSTNSISTVLVIDVTADFFL